MHARDTFTAVYEVDGSAEIGTITINILNSSGDLESFPDVALPWTFSIERSIDTPGEAYLSAKIAEDQFNPDDNYQSITLSISIGDTILAGLTRPDQAEEANETDEKNWNGTPLFIIENLWQHWDIDPVIEE